MLLFSCSDMIEFSPYDTDIHTHNINLTEGEKVTNESLSASDTFKFALISDIHENYDDMSDAINSINMQPGLRFVVCCGDVTDKGLSQEYEWYLDVAKESYYPVITVIGNHDYRSNGYDVFNRLFGTPNISFASGNYNFILFDDVIWERNNKSPRYEWLISELADSTRYNIVITHIPPWSDQMEGINNIVFQQIVNANNTILCLHGHDHMFYETYYNCIHTLVSESINAREYYVINLVDSQAIIKKISF